MSPSVREERSDQQRPEHEAETDHGVQGLLNDVTNDITFK